MSSAGSTTRGAWTLAAIAGMALALRLWAAGWGLPDVLHPDEPYILNRALGFAKGDLNPRNFLYPTLYFYVLFAWEAGFFVVGRLAGVYGSLAAFEREYFVDPTHLMIAGRVLTALFGVATIAAVYRFGTRLFDRRTGLGAALLLAVAPFAVRDAHYIKHDVPVTLFIVLAQAACARLVIDADAAERRGPWAIAGALAGLSLSTQYYAFPVVVSIVIAAIIQASRSGRWREAFAMLLVSAAASIAAFVATSPFLLIEIRTAIRDMVAVRQIDVDRAVTGSGAFTSLGAYVRMMAADAIGWPAALAATAGFVIALARDWRRGVLLISFPTAFLAFLANTVPMSRYLNAMLPSLALAAAVAISSAIGALEQRAIRVPPWLAAAIFLVIGAPGLVGSVRSDRFFGRADTRTLARQFIERTAPAGTTVLVQPHGVPVRPSRDAIVEALRAHLGSESAASVKFQKQIAAASIISPTYRVLYLGRVTDGGLDPDKFYVSPQAVDEDAGLTPLRARRVAYVAVTRYNTGNSAFEPLTAALQREAHLLATFSPYRVDVSPARRAATPPFLHNTADRIDPALDRPGPTVDVWKID